MMFRFSFFRASLLIVLALPLFVLPALGTGVFMSPDETANAVAATTFATGGTFRIPDAGSVSPWLHPRSFITHEGALVPVGFLGMPLILALLVLIVGVPGIAFFTPILVLLTLIPLTAMVKDRGRVATEAAWITWLTYPTIVLYTNRGLFANVPVVCLALWAAWCVYQRMTVARALGAGMLVGLAFLLRPTEMVWVIPFVATVGWSAWNGAEKRTRVFSLLGAFAALSVCVVIFGWLGSQTYGRWFVSGYNIRESMTSFMAPSEPVATDRIVSDSSLRLWPFGFHPRNMWFNVRAYECGLLFPWTLVTFVAAAYAWRVQAHRRWIILGVWCMVAIVLVNGQGIYQDNVRTNAVSMANSFARYAVPFGIAAVFSVAWGTSELLKRFQSRTAVVLVMTGVAFLGGFGVWSAFARDNESLFANRAELVRYAAIRAQAVRVLPASAVVFSERSDKIFFPRFRAVSPLPGMTDIAAFMNASGAPVAVFIRPPSPEQLQRWHQSGLVLRPLIEAGNETLYRVLRESLLE